jgi:hypothetical protein
MLNLLSARSASSFGRGAGAWLVSACFALGMACSDDDPAPESVSGSAGSSASVPDASVRDLPGDGRETTPDFDTDSRQRDPIGPQVLGESVDEIRNELDPGYGYHAPDAGDAGTGDAADAG